MDPAAHLMAQALGTTAAGAVALGDRPLLVGMAEPALLAVLECRGAGAIVWSRRVLAGPPVDAAPWPPAIPCTAALVRLPKAKAELDLLLDAAAARLPPGSPILLAGANNEGIRSAARHLDGVAEGVATLAVGNHCRVLAGVRRVGIDGLVGSLAGWRRVGTIDLGEGPRPWVSYPGLFAGGRLDDGTGLLLAHLPPLPAVARVLDFAAGTGTIAAAVAARWPAARIVALDNDTVALEAVRENVPGIRCIASLGVGALRSADAGATGPFDAILSNPPLHDGVAEDHGVALRLIAEAPSHLAPGGALQIVVQRRVGVRAALERAFEAVEAVADDGRFSVWRARRRGRGLRL